MIAFPMKPKYSESEQALRAEKPEKDHSTNRRRVLGGIALSLGGVIGSAYLAKNLFQNEATDGGRSLVNEKAYGEFLESIELKFISPNELIRPHRNIRGGVANTLPPKSLWKNIRKPLLVADAIRKELGVPLTLINSAYRSPAYNAKCSGSAKRSYHLQNMALDLTFACSSGEAAAVARSLRVSGLFRGGIGVYSSFIHIDARGYNASW